MSKKNSQRLFEKLNDLKVPINFPSLKYLKVSDLEKDRKYKILFSKQIKTKFGNSILLIFDLSSLTENGSIFLPRRYSKNLTSEDIKNLKDYSFSVDNDSTFSFHIIDNNVESDELSD